MIEHIKEYDEEIIRLIEDYPVHFTRMILSKCVHKERTVDRTYLYDYIRRSTPKLESGFYKLTTRIYWLLNDIEDFPLCHNPNCPNPKLIGFNVKNMKDGYVKFCSRACQYSSKEWLSSVEDGVSKKYGVKNYFMTNEFRKRYSEIVEENEKKKYETRKENHSFRASEKENDVYRILLNKFDATDIVRQYSEERYPYSCDFYIKSLDTFIEYNGNWTHGGHPYDETSEEDRKLVEKWKEKKTDFYDNAIENWTIRDPIKRETAKNNNLNYIEFWNVSEARKYVGVNTIRDVEQLNVKWDRKRANYEYGYYCSTDVPILNPIVSRNNYIIKYFQQDSFFRKEKEIWRTDESMKERLLENRIKYLNKSENELTSEDMLCGFKKSGIYHGYSHFNPLWFKWFIQKYNVKRCYDPCGGWGHRLLGGLGLEKYIYNDLSRSTKENVDRIVEYFDLKNVITYCEDAGSFKPTDNFDAMFTCPPYFNVEEYECGKFADIEEYNWFIGTLFDIFWKTPECKIFGLVIREDILPKKFQYFKEKFLVNAKNESYFNLEKNRFNEYMYIFEK
jgi:hypothetical protein